MQLISELPVKLPFEEEAHLPGIAHPARAIEVHDNKRVPLRRTDEVATLAKRGLGVLAKEPICRER